MIEGAKDLPRAERAPTFRLIELAPLNRWCGHSRLADRDGRCPAKRRGRRQLQRQLWRHPVREQQGQLRFRAFRSGGEAMNASAAVAAFLAAALAIAVPHPSLAADETVPSDSCNVHERRNRVRQ